MKTVAAVFPTLQNAEQVARHLENLGFTTDQIHIVAGNDPAHKPETGTTEAAVDGARFGGGLGIFASLVFLAVPGVGPVIAGGAMATVIAGLGIGAAAGGLLGAFKNLGISHEDAGLYEEAVRRGKVFVAVHAGDDASEQQVSRIMHDYGAEDIRHPSETSSDPADSAIKWHEEPENAEIPATRVRTYPRENLS